MPTRSPAVEAVVSRLLQVRQLWDEAAAAYFDADRFHLSLQNCISLARTVSFVLQSNKDAISDFDEWYGTYRAKWAADRVMVWARDARNAIEKQGDLLTCSQVRARIIASYSEEEDPVSEWTPQNLFATPHQIFASVPSRILVPHVRENGTLIIERRWVDTNLPDMEVLEAVAHVYGQLTDMVVDLVARSNLSVPTKVFQSRPDAGGSLAMDRAIYLSMKDGSRIGLRHFVKSDTELTAATKRKLIRRYGVDRLKPLEDAKTLSTIADAFFNMARIVMLRDGYHRNFIMLFRDNALVRFIETEFPDRAAKYVMMRDFAKLAHVDKADSILMIGEAWTASGENIPKSGYAADAPDRGEGLTLHAGNSKGESFTLQASVERKKIKRWKVKRLGKTRKDDTGYPFVLSPFFRVWNCVNPERLAIAIKQQDEMGIERTPISTVSPKS